MREMKDSGIAWIGNVPSNWKLSKIKYMTTQRECVGKYTPEKDKFIGLENVIGFADRYIETSTEYETSIYDVCHKGDILFGRLRPYLAKILTVPFDGYCTGEFLVFDSFNGCKNYLKYVLLSKPFIDEVNLSTYGAKMPRANADFILNMYLPLPQIVEQEKIVDFLDFKCSEIDAISADIQKEIEILEQYKRSIITEAVTKGLNPDAEMKDSGVAWCPQIPSHWQYSNPKGLFGLRTGRAFRDDRQLTASQEYGIVYQDEYMEKTGNKVVTVTKDFSILKHVEPDDFVISMRSFQGGLEYSDKRGCISSAYVMLIPNKEFVYAPFYRWFFKSSKYINALQSTSNLVRDGQAMRYANFVKVPLFIVPIEEQKAIASYLDEKIEKVNSILAAKKKQLEILSNYKKSLIYEYVTGKKEVLT